MCCPEGNVQQEIQPLDLYFRSGCTKTLFGLEIDLFLLIEVQNMRTVDTGGHMVKWRDLTVPGK